MPKNIILDQKKKKKISMFSVVVGFVLCFVVLLSFNAKEIEQFSDCRKTGKIETIYFGEKYKNICRQKIRIFLIPFFPISNQSKSHFTNGNYTFC